MLLSIEIVGKHQSLLVGNLMGFAQKSCKTVHIKKTHFKGHPRWTFQRNVFLIQLVWLWNDNLLQVESEQVEEIRLLDWLISGLQECTICLRMFPRTAKITWGGQFKETYFLFSLFDCQIIISSEHNIKWVNWIGWFQVWSFHFFSSPYWWQVPYRVKEPPEETEELPSLVHGSSC